MGGRISSSDSRIVTLENAISELKISLEYYKKELGKEEISKMILCGEIDDFDDVEIVAESSKDRPDAESPLAMYLQKQVDIPVVTVNPLQHIQMPKAHYIINLELF